jgi:uncharacterized protein (TIGR02594 family)
VSFVALVSAQGGALRRGAEDSAAVRRLQGALAQLGYAVEVDGDFGSATEDAVKDFQKQRGLGVDGVVGPKTVAAIDAALAALPQAKTTPMPGTSVDSDPPWFNRMTKMMGLYEYAGDADNREIIKMAQACGGTIRREYKHDSIPWCALAVNYALIAEGFPGNDSLWALDFRNYGTRLAGSARGAIATKKRQGGGHVFLVVGRTRDGEIIGRGGNQSDMVCDALFDPNELQYNWPPNYPLPEIGIQKLPVPIPSTHTKRDVTLA